MALKITLFLLAIIASAATATRDLPEQQPGFNLAARLHVEAEGGLIDCWNALTEIKSCSNEIVLFFVNGTTDIGPACCHAITMITHHCWPAMLTALGFTPDETNILRGYCDGSESAAPAPYSTAPALPPAAADAMMIV